MEDGEDQADLLPVAARELPERTVEVGAEARAPAPQPGRARRLRAGAPVEKRPPSLSRPCRSRSRRAGCRAGAGSRRCRGGCRGRRAGHCPPLDEGGRAGCGSSSSFRRRSDRGSRRPPRARRPSSHPRCRGARRRTCSVDPSRLRPPGDARTAELRRINALPARDPMLGAGTHHRRRPLIVRPEYVSADAGRKLCPLRSAALGREPRDQ